jgi:hypothetical protein
LLRDAACLLGAFLPVLGLVQDRIGHGGARELQVGSGTIVPGLALPNLERCNADTKRMPTARRRVPETRERDPTDLREVGIARTCSRVPRGWPPNWSAALIQAMRTGGARARHRRGAVESELSRPFDLIARLTATGPGNFTLSLCKFQSASLCKFQSASSTQPRALTGAIDD